MLLYCPTSTAVIINCKRTVLLLAVTSETEENVKAGNYTQKSQHSFQWKLDKMEYLNESSKKVWVRKELEKTVYDIKNGWGLRAKGFKQKKSMD